MSVGRQILRNAGALILARGVTALLTLGTTVYTARVLEPDAYGILSWALAYLAFFALIPDFGLGVYGAREIARARSRVSELVTHVLTMRMGLAAGAFAAYLLLLVPLDKPFLFKAVVALQGLTLFGQAASMEWVYQGVERMGVLAVRNVVVSALTLVGVLLLVRHPDDVILAAAANVAALLLGNGWLLITYWRDFGRIRLRIDWSAWKPILGPSLLIAGAHLMISIYTSMDQLMLGLMRTEEEVGWYAASYRLLTAAIIPSQIVLQAFLPSLSNAHGDVDAMRSRGGHFATTLFAIGLPLAATGALLAPDLIALFGRNYAPAAPALAVLMVNTAFFYVNLAYGNPLIAWNRERYYTYALMAGAGANVILNFVLIPSHGITGAATATLLSEATVLGGVLYAHHRVTQRLHLLSLLRALLATALSVGGGGVLRATFDLSLVPTLLLIALLYAVGVYVFGVVDLRRLWSLARS